MSSLTEEDIIDCHLQQIGMIQYYQNYLLIIISAAVCRVLKACSVN